MPVASRPSATPAPDFEEPLLDTDRSGTSFEQEEGETAQTFTQRLANMGVPEKVKCAMKGTREMRAMLIRDPNRMVASAVLSCPKVNDAEVEAFAKMGNVSEDILRTIASTRAWTKNYSVTLSLVKNSKTPVAMSMNLMQRLTESDVKKLSTDRNVPEALRLAARKRAGFEPEVADAAAGGLRSIPTASATTRPCRPRPARARPRSAASSAGRSPARRRSGWWPWWRRNRAS